MTRPIEGRQCRRNVKTGLYEAGLRLIGLSYDKFEKRNPAASMIGCLPVCATLQGNAATDV
jgi:hypothetical protein